MAITIKEIAKKANTSIATVSRVLNNSDKVSQDTRRRILDIMDKYNYQKNRLASGLVRGKSQVVALVTPNDEGFFNAYYFKQLFYGINKAANERGYNILIHQQNISGDFIPESRFPVDGYIFISPAIGNPLIKALSKTNKPMVLLNHKSDEFSWVDIDNVAASVEIINHLTALGHREIGIITGGENIQNSVERIEGYRKGLEANEIELNTDNMVNGNFNEKDAYFATEKLLERNPSLTSIMAFNDLMAVGSIRYLSDRGMNVPNDIAVIGFDDIDGICFFNPPITTYRQPFFEMGFTAVDMLINQVEKDDLEVSNVEFKGKLVLRESCGAHLAGVAV